MIFTELNLRNFWMINVKKINVEKKGIMYHKTLLVQ